MKYSTYYQAKKLPLASNLTEIVSPEVETKAKDARTARIIGPNKKFISSVRVSPKFLEHSRRYFFLIKNYLGKFKLDYSVYKTS